ncbi:olfactory receptor 56A4-like [Lethenteron reissneri]|uniref:olfactory receptor 56A4-like n=1 Tax=Lethenteron reissneri TaxID=7753 RepID=UPI002AB7375F|nr:olfactory receptor 56A4-like [Lethenteron reissneri]XP_061435855.1 olfactory receptor 56A4-like [Lethenteron reissneri]
MAATGEWNSSTNLSADVPADLIFMSTLFREPASVRFTSFALVLLIYLASLVGNSLLIVTVTCDHRLHKPMYVLIAALSIADVIQSTSTMPRILYDFFSDNYITMGQCFTQIFFYHVSLRDQGYVLAVMSVDRYLAVCRPLQYPSLVSLRVTFKALALTLLLAAAQAVGYVVQVTSLDFCRPKVILAANCDNLVVINMSCTRSVANVVYSYVNVLSGVAAPLVLVVAMYSLILVECRRRGGQRRAAETCGAHLLVIALYFGSVFFTIASGFQVFAHLPREVRAPFQTMHYTLPPALNPVIYGLRTGAIRRGASRLLLRRRGWAIGNGVKGGDGGQ